MSMGPSRASVLKPEEVAGYLHVRKETVYRYIRTGKLPAVRLGRSYRISQTDVDIFLLKAGTRTATSSAFTDEDSLWRLVGIANEGPHDVSENKHKYLAEAYADLHE